jgi:hypothetical protein
VIYADILISWFLAAVLEIYTQHFTRRLHFTQQWRHNGKGNTIHNKLISKTLLTRAKGREERVIIYKKT